MKGAISTPLFSKKIRLVNDKFYLLYLYYSSDLYLCLVPYAHGLGGHPSLKLLGYKWGL